MWKCFCNTTNVLLISAWLYITFLGFERSFNLQIYLKRRKAIVKSMVKVNGVNGKLDRIKLMHKCSSYLERAYLNERTDCILQLECSFDFLVFLFSYSLGSSRSQMLLKTSDRRSYHRKTPALKSSINNVASLKDFFLLKRVSNTGVFLRILQTF